MAFSGATTGCSGVQTRCGHSKERDRLLRHHRGTICFMKTSIATLAAIVLAGDGAVAQTGEETFKLVASDGSTQDYFGTSVAISGTTAIVGAPLHDDMGINSGAAYLIDTTTGVQIHKLLASDGAAFDVFGHSVAISGTTAIVGAYGDDFVGAAYLFDTTTGLQISKLVPSDGTGNNLFGYSVGISGTTAIVGAFYNDTLPGGSGAAYLFDTTTGSEIHKLVASDGMAQDFFGRTVALSGTTAIVGAYGDEDRGADFGSAYLFDTTTGMETVKLFANDGAAHARFGDSVAISGTTAIVGAWRDDALGDGSGSAYLFDTTSGVQVAKLVPSDGTDFDFFGWSVAISGTTAIVGARGNDDSGILTGSAYLFDMTTGSQTDKLLASDGAAGDQFGWSVAISNATAIVGANEDDDLGDRSGSAYLYSIPAGVPVPAMPASALLTLVAAMTALGACLLRSRG